MVLLKSFISSSSIKINIVVIDYTVDHLYFSMLKLDYYLLAINVIKLQDSQNRSKMTLLKEGVDDFFYFH
jgi:hypothetical protein